MSKKSKSKVDAHAVADFKDRTRHEEGHAEARVHNSIGEAIRESGEFQEVVAKHDEKEARMRAIRERNYNAFMEVPKAYHKMTYGFLEYQYRLHMDSEDPAKVEIAKSACLELNRRDEKKAQRDAENTAKRDEIEFRNDAAWQSSPRDFTKMTYGFLKKLASKDEKFIAHLKETKGYEVGPFDCLDAGFELQRREMVRKEKIQKTRDKLDKLAQDPDASQKEVDRLISDLNHLEGVTESAEQW